MNDGANASGWIHEQDRRTIGDQNQNWNVLLTCYNRVAIGQSIIECERTAPGVLARNDANSSSVDLLRSNEIM